MQFYGSRRTLASEPWTNERLRANAPSIFATQPWSGMSERYAFIPTIDVVEKMRAEGFLPYSAKQSRSRIPGKGEFTKHMIRFRHQSASMEKRLGGLYPEIVLTNAHDGASAYKIDAGLFRLICMNGLMVCDREMNAMSVRHTGAVDGILEASYQIVEDFPRVLERAADFDRLQLAAPEREAFGRAALALRYDEGEAPVAAVQVIQPRRAEDAAPTLWNTFNTVQERLLNGGDRYRTEASGSYATRDYKPARRAKTRAVNGISESARLNKALWQLTEEMAKLKSQA